MPWREDDHDVADEGVLHEIAAASGVETTTEDAGDRVLADGEERRQRGVIGSPHVFAGDEAFVCPLLEISRIDGELRTHRRRQRARGAPLGCIHIPPRVLLQTSGHSDLRRLNEVRAVLPGVPVAGLLPGR
jgi:hypothetical protein